MISKLYLVRHGATALNAEGGENSVDRIRGWSDVPLNDVGRKEARQAAKDLKDVSVTLIACSDLIRSEETAKIINESIRAPLKIYFGLRPWDVGDLTGTSSKDAAPKMKEYITKKADIDLPGGESFNEFKERFLSLIRHLIRENTGEIVIVTHYRGTKLINAWIKAGQKDDEIDEKEFIRKEGCEPGSHELFNVKNGKLIPV